MCSILYPDNQDEMPAPSRIIDGLEWLIACGIIVALGLTLWAVEDPL